MIFQEKGCIWETELPTGVNNIFNGRTMVYGQTFATIKLANQKFSETKYLTEQLDTLFQGSHWIIILIYLQRNFPTSPPNKQSPPFSTHQLFIPKQIFHPPCFIRTPFSIFNRLLVTGIDKKYSKQNIRKEPTFKNTAISRQS